MEESILQDKEVKRPNLARELESKLYDEQFMALGRLNPSAISVDEYDADPSYDQTWLKDAYHTYNNSKDDIGIMTERGAIRNEIVPKLQDLDVQEQYQQTRQQLQQVQEQLRNAQVGSKEYEQLSQQYNDLSNTLSEQRSGYDDLVRRNGNKELPITDIQGSRESLLADLEDRKKRIQEYQKDMGDRAQEYTISDEFKENEQAAHDKSLFSKDYLKYALPGTVGSSMNTWKAMVGTAAASYAASRARTMVLSKAAALGGPGGLVVGEVAANALAVGTVVGNIYSTYYQRDQESLAQTFGAHKERAKQQLSNAGVQDKQVVDAARMQAKQQGENLDNVPDEEIIDRLVSGEMKTGNKQLDGIFTGNQTAINEVYRRNMALGLSDAAQLVMVLPPVAGAFKTVAKMSIPGAVAKATNSTFKKAERAIDFATELGMKSNTTRAKVAKGILKNAGKLGVASMMEGVEEGDQDVFDYNFSKGKYDNASGRALGTLLGVAEDKVQLAKILTGIDTTSELANDKQLWNDMKGGVAVGLLLSAGPVVGHSINDTRKDVKVNNYVKGVVADQLTNKDRFIKANVYTNKAVSGKQDLVLQALDELKKYKPDGITDADIDEEIEHAKSVFNTAENPLNKQLAKELGIGVKSEQYGKLIGLQDYTRNKAKDITKELEASAQQFNAAMDRHKLDGNVSILGNLTDPLASVNRSPLAPVTDEKLSNVTQSVDSFSKNVIARNAVTELLKDLDAYSENNKINNLGDDLGINDKHLTEIKKSLKKRLADLTEAESIAKSELTEEQVTALDNAVNTRVLRSSDAARAYKQMSLLSSALESNQRDLNDLTGMVGDKFLSTLDKDEKAKAVSGLSKYLNGINKGLEENEHQIVEMREEAEKKATEEAAPIVPNVEEATVPKSIDEVLPPPPVDAVIKPSTVDVSDKKPARPIVESTPEDTDPDASFGEGDEDLLLSMDEGESKELTEEQAKKVLNIPTTPPVPSTTAPKSADMGVLPDNTEEEPTTEEDSFGEDGEDVDVDSYDESEVEPDPEDSYDEEGGGTRTPRVIKTADEAKSERGLVQKLEGQSVLEADEEALAILGNQGTGIDFMSSTLFFIPLSETPLSITIDGKPATGHKSGKQLAEKLKDLEFIKTAKYEFKVGTYEKLALDDNKNTWGNFVVLCYIYGNDGNTYVATFRTPETAQRFYDEYNKKQEIQSLPETSKVVLFKAQQDSITKLIANRNKVIEAWFNRKEGEHITPTSVNLSNGKFDNLTKSRPVSENKNLGFPTPDKCTPEHVKMGIGKGMRGGKLAYTIADPTNGAVLPGFGRSGDVYIYPTTEPFRSGKPTAVTIDKVKIGSIKGLAKSLVNYMLYDVLPNDSFTDSNKEIVDKFVNVFLQHGGLTVDDFGVDFLRRKQIYTDNATGANEITVGGKDYVIDDITEKEFNEIVDYVSNNMNVRVGSEFVFKPISEIFPTLATMLDEVGEVKFAEGLTMTKDDLQLTYLGYLVKHGYLTSNLSDNIFKEPFQYVDLGEGGNSGIATVTEDPKPVKPTKTTDGKKPKTFGRTSRKTGGAKYTSTDQSNNPITEKEMRWLRNILGFESDKLKVVSEISGLLGSSAQVLGLMRQDSIQISTRAVRGVAYHEGYHRLSLLLLSEQEREALYDQFAKEHNIPNNTVADKIALEEMMADDFANYMLNPIRRAKYLINKWYKALKHFITKTSKLSDRRVEDVYHKFARGGYKNVAENADSVKRFNELYMDGAPFMLDGVPLKYITNVSVKETVDALVALMFDSADFTTLADGNKLAKESLVEFLSKENLELLQEAEGYTDSQIEALTEVSDNFETLFWPRVKKALDKFSLRAIDSEELMDIEADDAVDDTENSGVSNDLSQHTKASIEISKKANAMVEVKILIATIADVKRVNGEILSVLNETTGLPVFVDFNVSWNKVLNGLHGQTTYDGLLKEAARLSKHDVFFDSVYETLKYITDENLRTKILNTISSSFHNMNEIDVLDVADDEGNKIQILELYDANVLRASRVYPELWNGQLLESDMFVKVDEKFVPNKTKMANVAKLYSKIVDLTNNKTSDVSKIKEAVVLVLNRVGVSVDVQTLNAYIDSVSDSENEHERILNALQAPGKGNLSSLFNWFKEMSESETGEVMVWGGRSLDIYTFYKRINALKDLAIEYATLNPNPAELTVLGADNSMLYPISQHNYLSGTVDRLNKTMDDVLDLSTVTYVSGVKKGNRNVGEGSLIIAQMGRSKNPAKMKFHTMVNFKVKNSADKGRKYTGISDVEDYLMKMCYVANDHIVLPTMGDSSMYNTISGIKLLHASGNVNTLPDGRMQYRFSDEALHQMFLYLRTEYETILNNYNNEKFLEEHPERKVKNYHTGTRNGYRFRYFNRFEFVDPKTGEVILKDFDQMLIEAEKKDGNDLDRPAVRAQLEWIRKNFIEGNGTKIYTMLNDFLLHDFKKELEKANSLGLIEYNGNVANVTNLLLDKKQVSKRAEKFNRYGNSKDGLAAVDLLADYFINTVTSTIEIEKVFIQDPAYYKWKQQGLHFADKSVDKIKRLREVLSTGVVPRTDFSDGHSLANKPNFNVATLNDNVFVERQIQKVNDNARLAYTVDLLRTMYNIQDGTAKRMAQDEEHMKKYYPDVLDAVKIKTDILVGGVDGKHGYKQVNQTDATVLISPQMYRELVERVDGWSPELEKAFNLLNDEDANWENNPQLYAESLAITLKPLKFMYFGEHIDHDLGISVPVFDKMAMFPVHKIFSTGDMGEVLKVMEEKNIQMVAFDSAVKVGMRKSTDMFVDGAINPELANIQVYEQQFRNLRRQLITDPHHAERQMFVTQGQKQAIGNIRNDREYTLVDSEVKMSGSDIKTAVKKSLDGLTMKGRERIYKRFGVTEDVDDNGDLIGYNLDVDKFYEELKTKAENSDMNQNIIQSLTKVNGKSYVPLSSMSDNNWIESALTSIFNKEIIDVNLPGGMFIQMSAVLYNRVSVTSDKESIRQLNYINDDGSMDCVISLNLLKHILPKDKEYTFSEAKAWLLEHNVIGPDSKPMAMGYRIPAQGQSSLAALKIVDIYPEQIGDTITLPDAFTTLTGSDYDVDKLYVARYNFNRDGSKTSFKEPNKNESFDDFVKRQYNEYAGDITAEESERGEDGKALLFNTWRENHSGNDPYSFNSREAVENRLLDCYLAVLSHPLHFHETRIPLDVSTDNVKEALEDIEKDAITVRDGSFRFVTPRFQSDKKAELGNGKNGIAPFALASAHHVLSQLVNLRFNKKTFARLEQYGLKDPSGIKDKDGINILDWLSAMINAHVDCAKDPYIIRLNVTPYTYNITGLLLRCGMGKSTFYFLSQPALKRFTAAANKESGIYGINSTVGETTRVDRAIEAIVEDLRNEALSAATGDEVNQVEQFDANEFGNPADMFDIDMLRSHLKDSNSFDHKFFQYRIASTFLAITPAAKELSELTSLSQVDTKKFGNNFSLYDQFMSRLSKFLLESKVFYNHKKLFTDTFLDQKIRDGIQFPVKLMSNRLLRTNDGFTYARKLMLMLTNGIGSKDVTYLKNINKTIEGLIKSKYFKDRLSDEKIQSLLYGDESIPKRLRKIKDNITDYPELVGSSGNIANELLDYLDKGYATDNVDLMLPDTLRLKVSKTSDGNIDDVFIRAWEELLDSDNAEIRKFAEDLVDYAFLTSGDNFSPNAIFSYVPKSYRELPLQDGRSYEDYMRDAERSVVISQTDLDNTFKHLWWNDKVVPEVKIFEMSYDEEMNKVRSNIPGIWTKWDDSRNPTMNGVTHSYPLLFTNSKAKLSETFNKDNKPVYPPYVKVKLDGSNNPAGVILYRFVGIDPAMKPIYKVTNKLGLNYKGNVVFEGSGKSHQVSFNTASGVKTVEAKHSFVPLNNPYGHDMRVVDIVNMARMDEEIRGTLYFSELYNRYATSGSKATWLYTDVYPKDLLTTLTSYEDAVSGDVNRTQSIENAETLSTVDETTSAQNNAEKSETERLVQALKDANLNVNDMSIEMQQAYADSTQQDMLIEMAKSDEVKSQDATKTDVLEKALSTPTTPQPTQTEINFNDTTEYPDTEMKHCKD